MVARGASCIHYFRLINLGTINRLVCVQERPGHPNRFMRRGLCTAQEENGCEPGARRYRPMAKVTFDYSKAKSFVKEEEVKNIESQVLAAKELLVSGTGAGNDFLGWVNLPVDYDKEEFARIQKAAAKIQSDSDVLLVLGIGGSYLGARAAINFLRHNFYNTVSKEIRKTPEIYFAGNSISGTYLANLVDVIGDRDFSINVISKSGTTTETSIAFRLFRELA